jgi:hypothetical protein
MVTDLADDHFPVREKASKDLADYLQKHSYEGLARLGKAVDQNIPDLEVKTRLKRIIEPIAREHAHASISPVLERITTSNPDLPLDDSLLQRLGNFLRMPNDLGERKLAGLEGLQKVMNASGADNPAEEYKGLLSQILELKDRKGLQDKVKDLKSIKLVTGNVYDNKGSTDYGGPVTDAGLRELASLTKLESLQLDGCDISKDTLERLTSLKSLKSLSLSRIDLKDDGAKAIGKLTQLESLNLSGCRINDNQALDLSGLTKLTHLALGKNNSYCGDDAPLTDKGMAVLKNFPNLQVLNLNGAGVTDAGLEHIKDHKQLTSLNVSGTNISDKGAKVLAGLTGLKELAVDNVQIKDEGLKSLESLTKLEKLVISSENLEDGGFNSFARFPELNTLTLTGYHFNEDRIKSLEGCKKLKTLFVDGSASEHEDAMERLQKAIPGLSIEVISTPS